MGTYQIEKKPFGTVADGTEAWLYTVTAEGGMGFSVTDYGATLVSVWVPDRNGCVQDVVLGYDDVSGYEKNSGHLGAVVGRSANRIAGGRYTLNGRVYQLAVNNGPNNLHSGPDYYDKRFWQVQELEQGVQFTLHSPDMDQGHPGNADITVTYMLTEENGVLLDYQASCDQDTVMNLTNHSYFNLDGAEGKSVLNHQVWIDADFFTIADENAIPTGELAPVAGTPMDFTEMKTLGRDIRADYQPLVWAGGYDHNYVLNHPGTDRPAAVYQNGGLRMEVYTSLPGLQLYTSNGLKAEGKNHAQYGPFSAVCFETQYYPNSINIPAFPSPVLRKGEKYHAVTEYRFSCPAEA